MKCQKVRIWFQNPTIWVLYISITLTFLTVLCRKGAKMYKLQFLVTKSGKNWMWIFFQIQNYQIMRSYIYWNLLKVTRSFVLACDLQMKCFEKCIRFAHSMNLFWSTLQWFSVSLYRYNFNLYSFISTRRSTSNVYNKCLTFYNIDTHFL